MEELNSQQKLTAQLQKIHRKDEEEAAQKLARDLGLAYIDIAHVPINIDLLKIIDKEAAQSGLIMPFFKVGKKLRIAVVNPEYPETKKVIADLRADEYKININITSETGMKEAFSQYDSALIKQTEEIVNTFDEAQIEAYETEIIKLSELKNTIGSLPPRNGLNSILVGAIRTGASDVHIEPYKSKVKIRFRIDGVLQDIFEVVKDDTTNIINHLKHEAHIKLNINDKPQDGRFNFIINERSIDVRLSTLPTIYGESVVMRLLDNERRLFDLKELGLEGKAFEDVKKAIESPNGMILTTGPTGSGKTTTLYSLLQIINNGSNKIITLEDPVEYRVFGITQSQISTDNDYTFAKGLRAILRQDPDVVMVGEIRDIETAEIAAQAALTGHIVLSTLHTNNATATIARLINMGLANYMVAPALALVMAQRLTRRLCDACKTTKAVTESEREELTKISEGYREITGNTTQIPNELPRPIGCEKCSHTGFRGQIGLFEVFRVSDDIREAILNEKSQHDIQAMARSNGMLSLREDGLQKILKGITSFDEVMRVTADNQ